MAKDKKNTKDKKPKFSPYWIYGIIIALFLGCLLYTSDAADD